MHKKHNSIFSFRIAPVKQPRRNNQRLLDRSFIIFKSKIKANKNHIINFNDIKILYAMRYCAIIVYKLE